MRLALSLAVLLFAAGCGKSDRSLPYAGERIVAPADTTVKNTGSMEPTFTGGERIHIAPINIRDVREGDIVVTYWEGRELNTMHRVIGIRNVGGTIGLVTKGDANLERDPHITTAAELVGIVRPIAVASR